MKLYSYKLYDCTSQQYQSALCVLDATKATYFSTMWSLQGLKLRADSGGICAKIGEREIALPRGDYYNIPWEEIDDTICLYQTLGSQSIHFLNIEVSTSNGTAWAEFIDFASPFLDNEALMEIKLLGLEARLVELATSVHTGIKIGQTLTELDNTIAEIERCMTQRNSNYETYASYKRRFEQLRYNACIEVLRSDINDEKLVMLAIEEVYNTAIKRFKR